MGQSIRVLEFYLLGDYKGFGDGTSPMSDGMMVGPTIASLTNCAFVLKASIWFLFGSSWSVQLPRRLS